MNINDDERMVKLSLLLPKIKACLRANIASEVLPDRKAALAYKNQILGFLKESGSLDNP